MITREFPECNSRVPAKIAPRRAEIAVFSAINLLIINHCRLKWIVLLFIKDTYSFHHTVSNMFITNSLVITCLVRENP